MAESIVRRGPDSHGEWVDGERGIAFGHRRLSILDLSPLGHQPMISSSGRFVMVLNGEIYNFQDLRAQLESKGAIFKGTSDTEVLLAAIEEWGVQKTLEASVGMFALGVWDRKSHKLYLARDRFGEKPLFYGQCGKTFVFGSELKALARHPEWEATIDRDSVCAFLRHNYIPHPQSIYKGIFKLPPGTYLEIETQDLGRLLSPQPYWSAWDMVESARQRPFEGSAAEAIDLLEAALIKSVRGQMIADVPLGAFLSGGVDSSTIVALMQKISTKPVKTFTIGFTEKGYNEAVYAKAVAEHLGTDHHELYISPKEAMETVPHLSEFYDEPFSDSSQIPTFLVSKLARSNVTVSLSGDAGDELFGGYTRYHYAERIASIIHRTPRLARLSGSKLIQCFSEDFWDGLFSLMPRKKRLAHMGEKMHKLAGLLSSDSDMSLYGHLISHLYSPEHLVVGSTPLTNRIESRPIPPSLTSFTEKMMYLDMTNYLPDDILTKVDRASMAVSLESRVPLLDHQLAEFCWSLPMDLKIRDGQSKWLLRQVLYRHVPRQLIERPKMGFGVPVTEWIKGPLRDWAESLLSEAALKDANLLEVKPVRKLWSDHLSGQGAMGYLIWDILMLQDWSLRWETASSKPWAELRKAL
jgi:asparagine synthase (glutamine-hydrolysing)